LNQFFKMTLFGSILFILLNLTGCGAADTAQKETKKETATTEVSTKAENKTQPDTKQKAAVIETKTTAAPTESKQQQPEAEKTETEKSTQPAQQSISTTSKQTTITPPTATKNSGTATTKTAGTTSIKTTASTSAKPTSTPTSKTTSTTTAITTPAPKPAATAPKPVAAVTLSITGPKDRGTILLASKVNIQDGYTIFDVVKQAAKAKGIVVDSTGSGATAYIEGIDNIYEFDYCAKSGWMFKQNGATITKSVGVIKVKAGDRIECYYTE